MHDRSKGGKFPETWLVLVCALAVSGAVWPVAAAAADAAQEGHEFGKWPAINAMIHDEQQHNLNAEDRDFLIEVWFRPLPKVWAKSSPDNTLVGKKFGSRLAGYELGYTLTGDVYFRVCDMGHELERDFGVSAACGIETGQWYYVAAARVGESLRIYKDGRLVGNAAAPALGVVSNRVVFHVSYGPYGAQAHCAIREIRFWRLKKGAEMDFDGVVAEHAGMPGTPSAGLAAKADWSRWQFEAGGETVPDLGNNGNTLRYVPRGYHAQDEIPIKPFPEQPVGRIYYVDVGHVAAADTNAGVRDAPFKSIARGLKALRPGDVLHICKGRHVVKDSLLLPCGENGKPITVEGEEGTVLVGSEPLTGWSQTADGFWVIRGWQGLYHPPSDVKEWDARSHPANVVFADDDPLDYVTTKADLAPGCWNVEPVEGRGPKTIYLCPLPGMDPNTTRTEIAVCPGFFQLTEFNHVRNLHFTRAVGGLGIGGRGHVVENCRFDWMCGGVGFYGQDIVFRSNRLEWIGGIGGGGARLRFESNSMRFNAWRILDAGWSGGAIKFIPAAVDHVLRGNEFAYNRTATVWYDSANSGNVIEDNVMHDNQAAGIFDEFGFGNTMRGNVIYNNAGVIYLGNSCADVVERNIGFNNLWGIGLRGATTDRRKQTDPAKVQAAADEIMSKWDVRRYQGMLTWEREKPYRDLLLKYTTEYVDHEICRHNIFRENVLFDNGDGGWESTISRYPYGQPGVTVDPDAVNTYVSNYYGSSTGRNTNAPGRDAAALAAWRAASGQELGSVWINPWDKEKMPQWFQEKMAGFREGQFRPYREIVDLTGGDVRKFNPSRLLLRGRLAASPTLKVVDFPESGVRGAYFEADGERCLALWSRGGMGMTDWLLPAGQNEVVVENKWLKRRTVRAPDGRISLLVSDDAITLIGVAGEISEDRSVIIRLPEYNEVGKPVVGTIRLENQGTADLNYALQLDCSDGFTADVGQIRRTVPAAAHLEIPLALSPKPGATKGTYQVALRGDVGGKTVRKTKSFILGTRNVAPRATIHVDGDLSDWDQAKIPAEVADTRGQVLFGQDAWKGAADCSAKIRVAWIEDYNLFIGLEVTDDKLVVPPQAASPTASDSVQLFVDVRTPWKLYINDYGAGAFQLLIVPAAGGAEPTIEFIGPPLAHQKRVATKKTERGYTVEATVRFRNMDEPGWVAGREFRIGALINDCDDPAAGRKAVLGLWRTARDADRNCVSLTRYTLTE